MPIDPSAAGERTVNSFYLLNYRVFQSRRSTILFRDPGLPDLLSILVEVDPIAGKTSEQYPDAYPKDYPERVEKFCRNLLWRKITGDITVEFLEAAVDRMFSADEVTCAVDLERT